MAVAYKKLLEGLYEAGCRYVQFEGVKSMLTDEAARLNNRVLRERPEGLFVAFHAATDMLIRLHAACTEKNCKRNWLRFLNKQRKPAEYKTNGDVSKYTYDFF